MLSIFAIVVNFRLFLYLFSFLLQKAELKDLARQQKKAEQEAPKAEKESTAKEAKAAKAAARQVDIVPVD